jgi:GTPase SAR1 family protein
MRSFEIMKRWVEELKENGPKDIGNFVLIVVLAVVGNKIDRYDEE